MNDNDLPAGFMVGAVIGAIIGVIIASSIGMDDTFGLLIIAGPLTILGGCAVSYFTLMGTTEKESKRINNMHFYDGTLTLFNFSSDNGEPIRIKRVYDYNLNYHPSDIRYVGVTVGGVTTGGTYDAGNYYTNDPTRTDKFWLEYKDSKNPNGTVINKIKLSGKTLDSARKNSFIKQFLEDDTLTLMHKKDLEHESSIKASLDQGNSELAYRIMKMDTISMMLSKQECEKIKHWIEFGN